MGTEEDRRCGVGPLKESACLQGAANLLSYSFVLGFIFFGVTASYSYMSAVQTTSQAAFSFSATDIGIWYAMFEVGSILANLCATYFLTHKHIPNVLSIGLTVVIFGCFLHGLPHFYHDYGDKIKSTEGNITARNHILESLCQTDGSNITAKIDETTPGVSEEEQSNSKTGNIALYSIAGLLNGLGYAPFYPLGVVYIDKNVQNSHESSKYIGISLAFYTIGPVAGFGAGAAFLNLYVTLGDTYLTPDSVQWIGAYWIGYFVFAAFLLVMLPFLFMFPKRLPIPEPTKSKSNDEIATQLNVTEKANIINDKEEVEKGNGLRSLKDIVPTVKKLLTNPLYMLAVLASCTTVYNISGWISFLPKYFQVQFNYSASDANIYSGLLPPLFGSVAVFIGGWLSSKYKNSLQTDVKLVLGCSIVSTLFIIPLFFISCEQFPVQEPSIALNSTHCMNSCRCDPDLYIPVCGNGITYKTPCLVGCQDYHQLDEVISYTGCLCETNVTMSDGVCQESGCNAPIIWSVLSIASLFVLLWSTSPAVNMVLRCIPEEDKAFAMGVQSSLNSLLAWIPAPILYGTLIDSTCSIWEYPDSKFKGYCMEYDNVAYKNRYLGITVGAMVLTVVFLAMALFVSRMPRYHENGVDKKSYSLSSASQADDGDAQHSEL